MTVSFPLDGNQVPSIIRRPPGQRTGAQWQGASITARVMGYQFMAGPGSLSVYRKMIANPTLAFVQAATRAMMKTPKWSVEIDDDVPDEVAKFLEAAFVKHKATILNHATTALYFGRASWEKVWERVDGYLAPRLKPMVPDITTPMVHATTGELVGVKQGDTVLGLTKCYHYAYDGEAGDPYGRSRFENIRETAWRAWEDTRLKMAQYTTKAAGVVPVANMPLGTGEGPDGTIDENQMHAEALLRDLGTGKGIVMPNSFSHEIAEIIRDNPKLAELFMWRISFLEVASGHGAEFLDMMKAEETRMVRGYLWPERALLEGQFGTKAEAGVHQDIGLTICEQDLAGFVEDFNRCVVDDALEANWGERFKGKARIKVGPLLDTEKAFFRGLVRDLLLNPIALDTAAQIIDLDAHLDQGGYTKAAEIVTGMGPDVPEVEEPEKSDGDEPEPPATPEIQPAPIAASRVTLPPEAVPSVVPTPAQEQTMRAVSRGMLRRLLGR